MKTMERRFFLNTTGILGSGLLSGLGNATPFFNDSLLEQREVREVETFRKELETSLKTHPDCTHLAYNVVTPKKVLSRSKLTDGFQFKFRNINNDIVSFSNRNGIATVTITTD